jgi:hypothetical protein
MNTDRTKDMIQVMQAFLDGKTIEYKYEQNQWNEIIGSEPIWDWGNFDYRVKPEPVTGYMNVYEENKPPCIIGCVWTKKEYAIDNIASQRKFIKTIKIMEVID